MLTLYCRTCREGFRHNGGQLPEKCPRCANDADWITYDEANVPSIAYRLTWVDVRFLKALRIDPEHDANKS